ARARPPPPPRAGSWGARRSGRPVATLQKVQARVQTAPKIIIVACFSFQHSPMFGKAASSQTVLSLRSRISRRVAWYSGEVGALPRIQGGFRGLGWSGRAAFSGCRNGSGVVGRASGKVIDAALLP